MHRPSHLAREFFKKIRSQGVHETLAYSFEYLSIVLRREPQRPRMSFLAHRSSAAFEDEGALRSDAPVISILMPVYNTPPNVLDSAIRSVLAQTYPKWELCICDDASSSPETASILRQHLGTDPRIKIVRTENALHIALATNLAAEYATGEFIGFLDHDDLLTPDALFQMSRAITNHASADVLYSDEDKIEPDGSLSEPYLKPDWSPEHLLSSPYLLHLMLVRKSLFFELGGFRNEYTGAQDYDLALRATSCARQVVHIPRVLYHWRKLSGSAAAELDAKPQALLNARAAVEDFVKAQDGSARVEPGLLPGTFRTRWSLAEGHCVTLMMLTDSQQRQLDDGRNVYLVKNAVESIFSKSSFRNFKLLIIDNGAMPAFVRDAIEKLGAVVKIYNRSTAAFNFAAKVNAGLTYITTEDVVFLNDDIEVISPDWLEALLEQLSRTDVGVVGARLLYPDGRIQHAGIALGVNGPSAHLFHGQRPNTSYSGYGSVIRNYSAVTGAVLATKMSILRELLGFDKIFATDYNDIDFCLRVIDAGKRVVYTPFATLYHFEGATLKRSTVTSTDQAAFLERWGEKILTDPFYNPGLPRNRVDCALSRW